MAVALPLRGRFDNVLRNPKKAYMLDVPV